MFDISFLWVGLVEIVAHFIGGCTGFGATVFAAPFVTGTFGTAVGVPYGTLISIPLLYISGIRYFKHVLWKDLFKIVLLLSPTVLLGNIIYSYIPETEAKLVIGGLTLFIACRGVYQKFIKEPRELRDTGSISEEKDTLGSKIFRYACLCIGGVVQGAFTIGGPLITVYTIFAIKDKVKFRSTMLWVWIIVNTCFNLPSQYLSGQWTEYMWWALLIGTPLAAIGWYLGEYFQTKIRQDNFLKLVNCVLVITGGDMFIRALLTYFA